MANTYADFWTRRRVYWGMAGIVFICHAVLLFMRGVLWDDWVYYPSLVVGDFEQVRLYEFDKGTHLNYLIYSFFGLFPDVVLAHRIAIVLVAIGFAFACYAAFRLLLRQDRFSSFIFACLVACSPAYKVWQLIVTSNYIICFAVFIAAAALAAHSEGARCRNREIAGSVVLFVISFFHKGLLAYYATFYLSYCIYVCPMLPLVNGRRRIALKLRHFVFGVVPVFAYFLQETLWKPYLANYNEIGLNPTKLKYGLMAFARDGLRDSLRDVFGLRMVNFEIFFPIFIFAPFIFLLMRAFFVPTHDGNISYWRRFVNEVKSAYSPHAARFFCWGAVAYFFAALPYVVVGKGPNRDFFWNSRHALLIMPSLALFLMGAAYGFFDFRYFSSLKRLKVPFLFLLIWGSIVGNFHAQVSVYARWVKDSAVNLYLMEHRNELDSYGIIWFDDFFQVNGQPYTRLSTGPYAWYEYSGRMTHLWGPHQKWYGVSSRYTNLKLKDIRYDILRQPRRRYYLSEADPDAKQLTLQIRNGIWKGTETQYVFKDFGTRLLSDEIHKEWLREIVDIDSRPGESFLQPDDPVTPVKSNAHSAGSGSLPLISLTRGAPHA